MVLWPLPCEFCGVWASTSKVINEISVKFAWVFQYIYSFRRQFRRQFSTVFYVILQVPQISGHFCHHFYPFSLISQSILIRFSCIFAGSTFNYSGDCPEKFVKFERVFLKLLVRLVVNLLEYFKIYSFRRQFRHKFSTVYHVILQVPLDGITATAL